MEAARLMKTGFYWRKALETQFRGSEKFKYRLRGPETGLPIKGFGAKTFFELEAAGVLVARPCARSSTWPQEWTLWVWKLEEVLKEEEVVA